MFTSAQWNSVIILEDCGRGQRYHNIKTDTEFIKGNVACKDGIVMQLRPSRHTYEQEPNLFESQCSHCKVEKCHLFLTSTLPQGFPFWYMAPSSPQRRNLRVIHNLSFSLILTNTESIISPMDYFPKIYLKPIYFFISNATALLKPSMSFSGTL